MTAPMVASRIAPSVPDAKIMPKLWQQPARDQRSYDADDDVSDQPETGAANDQAGEPAGDRADDKRSYEFPLMQPRFEL